MSADLRFRRQFFATPEPVGGFPDWQRGSVGELQVRAHPDVDLVTLGRDGLQLALIGFLIDPARPNATNRDLLETLLTSARGCDEVVRAAAPLAGRWVLIAAEPGRTVTLNDACGLRALHYLIDERGACLASNPALLSRVRPVEPSPRYRAYLESEYRGKKLEYWLPSGMTLFAGVGHLVPNHYLDLESGRQVRFWPTSRLQPVDPAKGIAGGAALIRQLIAAGARRFPLALPITAGRDSRILLAGSRPRIDDIFTYTLLYRDMTEGSPDVAIPAGMLRAAGLSHHVIDCTAPPSAEFMEIYRGNVDLPHEDWGVIASGMLAGFPQDRVCLKGNCIEIARNTYFSDIAEEPTPQNIARWHLGGAEMPFVVEALEQWFPSAREACASTGMEVLDLFYWEHLMGSWQARSQLEWDIVQEAYTPYNHRPLLELLLGIPWRHRKPPRNQVWRGLVRELWPELDRWPINPQPVGRRVNYALRELLTSLGLLGPLRSAYRRGRARLGR